jgi:hypothetical protein
VFQTDLAGFAARYHLAASTAALWQWIVWVHGQALRAGYRWMTYADVVAGRPALRLVGAGT